MIKEQAVVHRILITRLGEKVFFQVRLPRDAHRVIGLEYDACKSEGNGYVSRLAFGWEGDTSFKRRKNKLIGRLTLRNSGCEGVFYQGDLIEDRNEWQYEGIAALGYTPRVWMLSTKRLETSFNVNGGLIEGYYEDHYGFGEYTELMYELRLYFWIEKCIV